MEKVLDGFSTQVKTSGVSYALKRICKGAVLGGLRPPALNSAHFVMQIATLVSVLIGLAVGPVTLEPQFVA